MFILFYVISMTAFIFACSYMLFGFISGGTNFSNKFPLLRLPLPQLQPDFSVKSLLQWENQALALKNTFLSSRFNLSKEEFIMYSIALGFNGVPLVCFLAPLMTSSDPASYLMKKVIFRKSPVLAMFAASIFQGVTAFYTSLLSLNLILICLTIVCELSDILCSSYPQEKVKATKRSDSCSGSSVRDGDNKCSSEKPSGSRTKTRESTLSPEGKSDSSMKSGNVSNFKNSIQPQIRIDNYDNGDPKKSEKLQNPEIPKEQQMFIEKSESFKSQIGKHPLSLENPRPSLDQIPGHDNQLCLSNPSTAFAFHPTFGSAAYFILSSESKHFSNTSTSPSFPETVQSTSMIMMELIEEPTVTVRQPPQPPSAIPAVKKLLCPTPIHRIKSSAEVLFVKSFQLYLQTKLLVLFINSAMYYYFPVVISVGMILSTLSAYATVKLHTAFPLPLRFSIFLIGVTIGTVMLVLLMEATEITKHSQEFLRYWKKRLRRKYSRKQLRTCQRLCFKVGPFVEFKKDTIFGVFSTIQQYTVNFAVI